jgi:hypothetical protein
MSTMWNSSTIKSNVKYNIIIITIMIFFKLNEQPAVTESTVISDYLLNGRARVSMT